VRVETQLVTVPAIVTDKTGRPIPTLRQENFAVFEDGKPQRLANFATTEAPFEIALFAGYIRLDARGPRPDPGRGERIC